jgi:hypothetical protein
MSQLVIKAEYVTKIMDKQLEARKYSLSGWDGKPGPGPIVIVVTILCELVLLNIQGCM